MLQYIFFLFLYPGLLLLSVFVGARYASHRLRLNKSWKNIGLESSLMSIYALLLSFALAGSSTHANQRNDEIDAVADKFSLVVKKSKYYEVQLRKGVQDYLKAFFAIHNDNLNPNAKETGKIIHEVILNDQKLDYFLTDYQKKHPESRSEISEITSNTSNLRSAYIRLTQNYGKTTPSLIMSILILYSLMMGFLIGFMKKVHSNQTFIVTSIFIIISAVMIGAIWDQDHPGVGFIKPNYESINDVSDLFKAYLLRDHV
ncbi:hypothetical protein EZ449_06330 [Pedobacter frigidisoli]|uniref:DUF4239 domain-containing protein n=1 Tax=Pedobacter frigidisoli TaxID=2530455 RepID=A0A4R0P8U4_9SPHI|nr:hypothetical protein [Pedobacter frigidisoli]TCD11107.1 hypothetical protein EZ449_06330 [Pedobacter frigidisoli]